MIYEIHKFASRLYKVTYFTPGLSIVRTHTTTEPRSRKNSAKYNYMSPQRTPKVVVI